MQDLLDDWAPFMHQGEVDMLRELTDKSGWWPQFLQLEKEYDNFVAFYERKQLLPDKPIIIKQGEQIPLLTSGFRYAAVNRYKYERASTSPFIDVILALECASIQKCYHLQNGAIVAGRIPDDLYPLVVDEMDNYISCSY